MSATIFPVTGPDATEFPVDSTEETVDTPGAVASYLAGYTALASTTTITTGMDVLAYAGATVAQPA